ncbi:MAG: cell division protein FtsB [Candidatus Omnitrophica bacterium CG11_big_fil_rev_8_21_14_0_20_64_10]|nr:MAG: cell division protein FtsB [Candidatus Omnitrophica bacterium CG11_big_fil_rev_8_21_14_0_20_64_10]
MDQRKALLIGGGVLLAAAVVYGPGLLRWAELKANEARLSAEVRDLKEENRMLTQEIDRLRKDPAYAESVAREQLGFTRPGEKIIRLNPDGSAEN